MQISWILKKFIRPDIRPDIRIVIKINRDLIWHRNMNSWKFHVTSYYHFWVIVWTNIQKRNRINGRISARITESDSNFYQHFKTTLTIYPENFMQIGWILRKFIPNRISGRISGWMTRPTSNFHQYFKTTLSIYPENFMQIGWILMKFIPNRISGWISGWITELASNFLQYFKTTIYTYLESFMQIGWILRKFIWPDIRPDIRIVTKIGRTLPMKGDIKSWKSHIASYYRSWVIVRTNRQTNRQTDRQTRPKTLPLRFHRRR